MIQVWLPLPSFKDSARTLSTSDLKKQRVDVVNLMDAFHEVAESELPRHEQESVRSDSPLYRMWYGFEMQLCEYGLEVCEEYDRRVGKNGPVDYYAIIARHLDWATGEESDMSKPNWFGDVDIHLSHQAALVRSDPEWYGKWYRVDTSLQLVWAWSKHAQT